MNREYIAITLGDPSGVGPEIILKSLADDDSIYKVCKPILVGDLGVVTKAIKDFNIDVKINTINHSENGVYTYKTIDLFDLGNIDMSTFKYGEISAQCGKAAWDYIEKCVELYKHEGIKAIATSPINKEALKAGNITFIGHTEMFGHLTNIEDPLTMFEVDSLRVFFLSRHLSLRDSIDMVKKDRLIDYITRTIEELKKLGVKGSLYVSGLNPHNGEHGLFGTEEMDEIEPAVKHCQELGMDVIGPIPADSVFYKGFSEKCGAVLSLYHDQGHIATKTYDFHRTISLTLGMPVLRTSVDHGTAFDIAGKNIADPVSMKESILLAAKYSGYTL
ncbi:4-hydroxythreonine-4-phosphate dehydrogenase PdxA [Candidatus Izimaplasma bacterium ZiA1]|uniref:4-hydroxythreonine-4-phosphate dehydrogenase PdxA n=1 Tax=Candidatus Izimoplasma sp. ZiA1 TaxID=2024899 RepID=UPI000BAA48F7|nr:4-hydroxythreonine-4-phosphate dehydrogenase PdxA [Candidatus Izimaplasma bacterium ZiA1]